MQENTLSGNLERIRVATDDIRNTLGTPGAAIEDVATDVANLNDDYNQLESDYNDEIQENESLRQQIQDITPKGTIDITDNGTINVSQYASANVNVSGGSGGGDGIYHVKSIEEMNALLGRKGSTAQEGDLCVVYNQAENNLADQPFNSITYHDNITLSTPYPETEYDEVFPVYAVGETDSNRSVYGDLRMSKHNVVLYVDYYDPSGEDYWSIYLDYYSEDGITYNLQSGQTGSGTITVSKMLYIMSPNYDGDTISSYLYEFLSKGLVSASVYFGGLFTCKSNNWRNTDIGLRETGTKVLSDTSVYTNSGIISGQLGNTWNKQTVGSMLDLTTNFMSVPLSTFSNGYNYESGPFAYTQYEYIPVSNYINLGDEKNFSSVFYSMQNLKSLDISDWDFSGCTSLVNFIGQNKQLTKVKFPNKVYDMGNGFSMSGIANSCKNLEEIDLSFIRTTPSTVWNNGSYPLGFMFRYCEKLKKIDIRNLDMSGANAHPTYQYNWCNIPTDCLIIVKDQTNKNYVRSSNSSLTNVKTVAEYEGGNA